jgi:hypothetical protein
MCASAKSQKGNNTPLPQLQIADSIGTPHIVPGTGYPSNPGGPQSFHPTSVRHEHCLEPGAIRHLLFDDMLGDVGLVPVLVLSFAKIPETIAKNRIVGLRRNISI